MAAVVTMPAAPARMSGVGQALAGFVVDRVGAFRVLCAGVALLGVAAIVLAGAASYPGAMMDAYHPSWVFLCIGLFQALAIGTAVGVGGGKRAAALQKA